jgi:hypothetical protein
LIGIFAVGQAANVMPIITLHRIRRLI